MSWHHVRAVFDTEGIPPTRKLVLLALARRAGDEGRAWPSIARLCLDTGMSDRAVRYALKDLVAGEWIIVHRAPGRGLTMTLAPAAFAAALRHEMPRPRQKTSFGAASGAGRSKKEYTKKGARDSGPRDDESWGEYRERGGR